MGGGKTQPNRNFFPNVVVVKEFFVIPSSVHRKLVSRETLR